MAGSSGTTQAVGVGAAGVRKQWRGLRRSRLVLKPNQGQLHPKAPQKNGWDEGYARWAGLRGRAP